MDTVSGYVNFTIRLGLYNHSANVNMIAQGNHNIRLTWRLRIRHDKRLKHDSTLFTYPNVEGCSVPKTTCNVWEDRYGDGYNVLPYEHEWKVFWEAYSTSLVYKGEKYPGSPKAQSDRATCYKTVSCKFK